MPLGRKERSNTAERRSALTYENASKSSFHRLSSSPSNSFGPEDILAPTDMNSNLLQKTPRSSSREGRSSRRSSSKHRSSKSSRRSADDEPKSKSSSSSRKLYDEDTSAPSNRKKSSSKHGGKSRPSTTSDIDSTLLDTHFQPLPLALALPSEGAGGGAEDSLQSSIEGTPVILSREGSRIRIIDEETGEIFFRKMTTKGKSSKPKNNKEPIFIPRMSSHIIEAQISKDQFSFSKSVLGVGPRRNILESPDNFDEQEDAPTAPPYSAEEDDVGDILVFDKPIQKQFNSLLAPPEEEVVDSGSIDSLDQPSSNTRGILKSKPKLSKLQDNNNPFLMEDDVMDSDNNNNAKVEDSNDENSIDGDYNLSRKGRKSRSASRRTRESTSAKLERISSRTRARSSRSKSSSGEKDATMMIPREIFEYIFTFLHTKQLKTCSRVCSRWKKMTDLRLRGPLIFTGKSFYGHHYAKQKCRDFVTRVQELEARYFRPVEILFKKANNRQLQTIVGRDLGAEFRSAVRHIESLRLQECTLQWRTLIMLLQSFSHARVLQDMNSSHFTKDGLLVCRRYRENYKKELSRKEFLDFKDQMRFLRKLTIGRPTISPELVIFLSILAQGSRSLHEIEVRLGPWEIPSSTDPSEFTRLLDSFVKELRNLLDKNKKLRKIKFIWLDKNFAGYFITCVEVLMSLRLNCLRELSLEFDPHAMRGKSSSDLREFIDYHFSRSLRTLRISKLLLSEEWKTTAGFIEKLEINPPCSGGYDFKIILTDTSPSSSGGGSKTSNSTAVSKIIQSRPFRHFTSSIHFQVGNETTKSISQIFGIDWQKKVRYPRVKNVLITFSPDVLPLKSYNSFNSYNVDILAKCFPNLTQLRISDRLMEHRQIFTRVLGRRKKVGVSKAGIGNKDLQAIGECLRKLRVLKLWVDLGGVDDHGLTGIHKDDIAVLREDDVNYSWNNFDNEVLPSFSNLKYLEELSLKGLGPSVTDISAKFGFENLSRLKILELGGKMKITKKGKQNLRRKFKEHGNGTVIRLQKCII